MYHYGRDDKDAEELQEVEQAQRLQWERLVLENQELLRALGHIRARHRLTMRTCEQAIAWMNAHALERRNVQEEVLALARRYDIPQQWQVNLLWFVYVGSFDSPPAPNVSISSGGPEVHWTLRPGGEVQTEIVISPDTPIANRYVVAQVREAQLRMDPPPQPVVVGPRGKLDWRNVYEWHLRHPDVTEKELAELLNIGYRTLRGKMAELKAK